MEGPVAAKSREFNRAYLTSIRDAIITRGTDQSVADHRKAQERIGHA